MEETEETIEMRRIVRETILRGYSQCLAPSQQKTFLSGLLKVTIFCLDKDNFQVMYEAHDPKISQEMSVYLWNTKDNTWRAT